MQHLNSNTLVSENPNLSIIMEPHRSRSPKLCEWLKCEHVLFIVFNIVIIAMLGSILQNKPILVSDGKANFAWVPSSNGQVPQEAIPGKEFCNFCNLTIHYRHRLSFTIFDLYAHSSAVFYYYPLANLPNFRPLPPQ